MFSSFEVHSVSTELSGEILYSADLSVEVSELVLGVAATMVVCGVIATGFGVVSGLGVGVIPFSCSVTVTVVLTTAPPPAPLTDDVIAPAAAPVRFATPPPIATA